MDAFVTYTANLRRVSVTEVSRITGLLLLLRQELVEELDSNPGITDYRRSRVEALIKQGQSTIATAYNEIEESNLGLNTSIAHLSARQTERTFRNLLIPLQSVITTEEQYRSLASNALINGAPSSDWWRKQTVNLQDAFAQQVRMGYISGESMDDIVRRVRGRATGKRHVYEINGKKKIFNEYVGGIMDTGTRQAAALVRTSVQQISADARMETFRDNAGILKGIMWVSTLDGRTTLLCASRDGKLYTVDGKPIDHDLPFLTGPPAHYNCRSTLVPVTKSWEEITGDKELDKMYGDIPAGTRASMDGQVPEVLEFNDWFNSKDQQFQESYLGTGRYNLWKQGKFRIQDMVAADGTPLTLSQLEALL